MKREEGILEDLKEAREEVFVDIYRKYRDSFILWTSRFYSCDRETALDCFQDAVIILMNNAKMGKLVQLDSGLKTYLFSIGKNILLKKYSMKRKEMAFGDLPAEYESAGLGEYDELFNHRNRLIDKVAEVATSLKEPCRSILKLYYYENLGMDKIAEALNYKNADTVKSQKLRCMKYLEESLGKEML